MTPSIEERREVAARLRYVAEHGAPEWETTACCIAECIGEDDYPLWNGSGLLFSKLADLIDPECWTRTVEDNLAMIERNRELEAELAGLKGRSE